jgi:hypothetical protein
MLTLINGNRQPYEIGLPKLVIVDGAKWNTGAIAHIKENTGIEFKKDHWNNLEAQPENCEQITKLFLTYNFKTRYYNNWNYKNTLMLKSDHHVGFDVNSICYSCCQENGIHTGSLKPTDRLSC